MSDDCISRQAILDVLQELWGSSGELMDRIMELPSVTSQPKTGHWILDADREHGRCSECGCKEDLVDGHSSYKWCSNCGAMMVEPQERSDKE